ncbi:MAG: 6-bladed beta-propeller [Gemmatimonadetes bacterium]|nr:6-bladed beta-propeller [Gemmatimonadota bacterium]
MSDRFEMRRTSAPLPATLTILLLSCGDGPAPDAGTDVPLTPATEDIYTVGEYAGEEWENFTRVDKVAFDASGNVHVFDPEAKRIVVVDQDGDFLHEIGGQGEGPGELSYPTSAV